MIRCGSSSYHGLLSITKETCCKYCIKIVGYANRGFLQLLAHGKTPTHNYKGGSKNQNIIKFLLPTAFLLLLRSNNSQKNLKLLLDLETLAPATPIFFTNFSQVKISISLRQLNC